MKKFENSTNLILTILKYFFRFIIIVLSSVCFILLLLIIGIFIDSPILESMNMKINVGEITLPVKDLVVLEKWKSLFLLFSIITIFIFEIYLLTTIVKIIKIFDLKNPFSIQISNHISKIISILIIIGTLSLLLGVFWGLVLGKHKNNTLEIDGSDFNFFIFAGILYVISKIYNRGVELQSENDLTI